MAFHLCKIAGVHIFFTFYFLNNFSELIIKKSFGYCSLNA
uniref:Uncharacterized protein n=1 Tax=Rhizophora mucronata TaxID=61149 RepID=A0A2P2NTN6_RHIMU